MIDKIIRERIGDANRSLDILQRVTGDEALKSPTGRSDAQIGRPRLLPAQGGATCRSPITLWNSAVSSKPGFRASARLSRYLHRHAECGVMVEPAPVATFKVPQP